MLGTYTPPAPYFVLIRQIATNEPNQHLLDKEPDPQV